MAVTDYKFAGTAANVDRDGMYNWTSPNNAKAADTIDASCTFEGKNAYGDWLRLTNFGFTSSDIPDGATINGIEFIVCRHANVSNYINDSAIYLYDDGAVGDNLASATYYPNNTRTEATYGGSTNMCGTSLTQADIVATTFGIQLSAAIGDTSNWTAYVDYIKIRVYYTEGGGATVKPHYYYLQQ
jgi:hypothetical protein